MFGNDHEIAGSLNLKGTIAAQMLEIRQINNEFLQLLLHPDAPAYNSLLGLDTSVIEALRQLCPEQQEMIAAVPGLLAEFRRWPTASEAASVADSEPVLQTQKPRWQRDLQGFADRLLTCIWQAARRDKGIAAACMGLNAATRRQLAQLDFRSLGLYSRHAHLSLNACHSAHPAFWPDLIACAQSRDPVRQVASQLSLIQLSVSHRYAGPADACLVLQTQYQ